MSTDRRKPAVMPRAIDASKSRITLKCMVEDLSSKVVTSNFIIKRDHKGGMRSISPGKQLSQSKHFLDKSNTDSLNNSRVESISKDNEISLNLKVASRRSSIAIQKPPTIRTADIPYKDLKESPPITPNTLSPSTIGSQHQEVKHSFFIKKTVSSPKKPEIIKIRPSSILNKSIEKSSDEISPQVNRYFQFKDLESEYGKKPLEFLRQASETLKELNMDRFSTNPTLPSRPEFTGSDKPILALDLDETLVHCCNYDGPDVKHETSLRYIPLKFSTIVEAKINVRPRTAWFLKKISKEYHVVVYTASDHDYASAVCRHIDPSGECIKQIYSRKHCIKTEKGFLVKDLRMLVGADTGRVVLADNSPHCFAPQIHNGIPILPYFEGKDDAELPKLYDFLMELKTQSSMPAYIKKYFCLTKLMKCQTDEDFKLHLESIGTF